MRITEATDTLRKLSKKDLEKHRDKILSCATFLAEYYGFEVRKPLIEYEVNYRKVKAKSMTSPTIDEKRKERILKEPKFILKTLHERDIIIPPAIKPADNRPPVGKQGFRCKEVAIRFGRNIAEKFRNIFSGESNRQRSTVHVIPEE
jgi:hypothetical protein